MQIGDGASFVTAWWSCGCGPTESGYFYGSLHSQVADSDVAWASGVSDIQQLTDASLFSFTNHATPLLLEGHFVVYRSTVSGHYAALRVDDIYGSDTYNTFLDATWWFQTDGTDNLANIPEPSSSHLGIVGLLWIGVRLSRMGCIGLKRLRKPVQAA
jgi:hypothetical protein